MNKYIVLALLPFCLQSSMIEAKAESAYKELNEIIKDELKAVREHINSTAVLELEAILGAVDKYQAKGGNNRIIAIYCLLLLQNAVQECNDAQYVTWGQNLGYWFGVHPTLVAKETRPALASIQDILSNRIKATPAELSQGNSNMLAWVAGGFVAGAIAVVAGGAILWGITPADVDLLNEMDKSVDPNKFNAKNVSNAWADAVINDILKISRFESYGDFNEVKKAAYDAAFTVLYSAEQTHGLAWYNKFAVAYSPEKTNKLKAEVILAARNKAAELKAKNAARAADERALHDIVVV